MAKIISRADLLAILKPGIEKLFEKPPDYIELDMQKYQIEVVDEETDDDKRETKTSE